MDNSLFWKFNTSDNPEYSIIYGTIHLGTAECMAHWDRVEPYMAPYPTIYTESSLSPEDLNYQQPFTLLDSTIRLNDYVTPNRWAKMRKIFLKYCAFDLNDFRMFLPLFIAAQVQSSLIGATGQMALDYHIWNKGRSDGKEVQGIETAEEQVAILLALDLRQQYLNLIRISRHISATRKKLNKLLEIYKREDITAMYKLSKGSLGKDRSTLIGRRNHIMAQRLISRHNEGAAFFSFGAGHLAGGNGILRLVKQSGATVRSIR